MRLTPTIEAARTAPHRARLTLVLLLFTFAVNQGAARAETVARDLFGRDIDLRGLTLVDWQGYMANPAIKLFIAPPDGAAFPVEVRVTSPEPRLYFDLPSTAGANGPAKRLQITAANPAPLSVAIFPARAKKRLETTLDIQLTDARGRRTQRKLPVHVIVNPGPANPETYPITVDFSQDKTGFFKNAAHRAVLEQAAQDWAFYFARIPLPTVAAHAEKTFIWKPNGFVQSDLVTNAQPYTGYLLYAYGITSAELRSGGEPSAAGAWQVSGGQTLPIRRSGGVEIETKGNYNQLGWLTALRDDEWWRATNLGNVKNDLYSIAHHEMGHALIFNPTNRNFRRDAALADDPAVAAYLGRGLKTDKADHLDGFVDPASLRGAFGNEYHGNVPPGRWLITKLDLLCAQAVGYKLRKTDALTALAILPGRLPDAVPGQPYKAALRAEGGIPSYDWIVKSGQLPDGLALDRFTGEISGSTREAGTFAFTVQLRDHTPNGAAIALEQSLTVTAR
jgi:hypothetical protein